MNPSPLYRILVRLPDRPGALGAAASRIGALRGDVVGFEIIQREAGAVLDEFVVSLPPEVPLELLSRELADAGVTVLDVAVVDGEPDDPVVTGLDARSRLLRCTDRSSALTVLTGQIGTCLRADWAVACTGGPDGTSVVEASWGEAPEPDLLRSLLASEGGGSDARVLTLPLASPELPLSSAELSMSTVASLTTTVLAGRQVPFGRTEVTRLAALVALADLVLDRSGGATP